MIVWPFTAAGRFKVVVIYPLDVPLHADRPAIGLEKFAEMVSL